MVLAKGANGYCQGHALKTPRDGSPQVVSLAGSLISDGMIFVTPSQAG